MTWHLKLWKEKNKLKKKSKWRKLLEESRRSKIRVKKECALKIRSLKLLPNTAPGNGRQYWTQLLRREWDILQMAKTV